MALNHQITLLILNIIGILYESSATQTNYITLKRLSFPAFCRLQCQKFFI